MRKDGRLTIRESGNAGYIDKFESICGDIPVSKAIISVLKFFIEYDPNYIRVNILRQQPLSDQEVSLLKAKPV